MKLTDLNKFNQIVIQVHDNPDADAVGSGFALYRYFNSLGKDVRLVYGGRNIISKSNMKLMVSELEIPIEHINSLDTPELLLTVDCQYGQGNVERFDAKNIAVIDHHQTGKLSDDMAEIRCNLSSCATICYSMLTAAGYNLNDDVPSSTASYYGLYMDSNQCSETKHPLDRDMVDYLKYDKQLISRLKYANFSLEELTTAGAALLKLEYYRQYNTAIVKSDPCDPSILGVIGDFVIQADNIDVCVIFNKCNGGYKLSVRSCSMESVANELADFLTKGIGSGGGHFDKAGGFISDNSFENISAGRTMERYLFDKIEDYFGNYDVVRYTDKISEPQKLRSYRKKPGMFGYVKSTDIAPAGSEFIIRTLEGDVSIKSNSDIYIMIGSFGEVYPLESKVFETKYTPLDEPYTEQFEYVPSVMDLAEGKPREILAFAKKCRSVQSGKVLARPLEKYTKVFTEWDYNAYMSGNIGDMLCYTEGNSRDVYVAKRDVFDNVYEEIK